jgi:hypothetical protein
MSRFASIKTGNRPLAVRVETAARLPAVPPRSAVLRERPRQGELSLPEGEEPAEMVVRGAAARVRFSLPVVS